MKRIHVFLTVCLAGMSLSSCDFLRSVAGRPTSAELNAVKKQKEEVRVDTVKVVETVTVVDTVLVKEPEYQLEKRNGRLSVPFAYTHTDSKLTVEPEYSYYVLVGTYRQKGTMNKMISLAKEAGYKSYLLKYDNGLVSVGLCPSNRLGEAVDSYLRLKKEKFCPSDACVLIAK